MVDSKQDCLEVFTRREVEATTLWLHGQGVSADDLTPILKNLTRSRELGLHYLAPNAPVINLSVNGGRPTRAWFDMVESENPGQVRYEGLESSRGRITQLLDEERGRGMPSVSTLVAGFSQGGTLGLHAALNYSQPLAGLVVLSGAVLDTQNLPKADESANGRTPILMVHGEEDEVVPLASAEQGRDWLREMGYHVEWKTLAMGHTVNAEAVEFIDHWIWNRLTTSGTRTTSA